VRREPSVWCLVAIALIALLGMAAVAFLAVSAEVM
jgi:hypothetical protein